MKRSRPALLAVMLLAALPAAGAESTTTEVLATEAVRVSRLALEPGEATPQHTHTASHLAAALVGGTLASVAGDGTATPRAMQEGALAWVPPGVTHALRNDGPTPFRAVTVDLLKPQTGARNRCAALLPGQPTDCPASATKPGKATLVPQMETAETLVGLLTLAPGKEQAFKAAATPPVVVALAGTEAKALIEVRIAGGAVGRGEKALREGDAATGLANSPLTIRNTGTMPARFIVIEIK